MAVPRGSHYCFKYEFALRFVSLMHGQGSRVHS